VFGNSLGFLK